jgi:hypothetical protein
MRRASSTNCPAGSPIITRCIRTALCAIDPHASSSRKPARLCQAFRGQQQPTGPDASVRDQLLENWSIRSQAPSIEANFTCALNVCKQLQNGSFSNATVQTECTFQSRGNAPSGKPCHPVHVLSVAKMATERTYVRVRSNRRRTLPLERRAQSGCQARAQAATGLGHSLLLDQHQRLRDRALFDLAIDSKLRGCDVVKMRIGDIVLGGHVRSSCRRKPADRYSSR